MVPNVKRIGELLIEKGLITEEQLTMALEEQKKTKEFLGVIFLKRRQIKEENLFAVLSERFNMPLVRLKDKYIDWNLVKGFSASLILDYKCFPFAKDEWSVTVAITNPLDIWGIKKAEEEARGLKLKVALTTQSDMDEIIERYRKCQKNPI